ncbi:BgTH12-00974 [Blumeria graminis f. sp. triticale]|uniref:BgTH12-00974 n=1 Tax=Blumeria graminis f. sp. triticale TaxID=1689686 RepID=A0A9W4D7A6_BLUGR|nr:BgTH12-00974 [Blumeria graminis f. sp. triticale]
MDEVWDDLHIKHTDLASAKTTTLAFAICNRRGPNF